MADCKKQLNLKFSTGAYLNILKKIDKFGFLYTAAPITAREIFCESMGFGCSFFESFDSLLLIFLVVGIDRGLLASQTLCNS